MERLRGYVIWFANGIGFICPEGCKEGESDIFFHFTEIVMPEEGAYKTVEAGMLVSFDVGKNHKGKMAIDVRRLEDE